MSIIPTKTFYGSTKKEYIYLLEKKRKRLKQEEEFKERPLSNIKSYNTCFSERKVWKQFYRQQEALDYCKSVRERAACLFAVEKSDGKRGYLVTTRKQFWEKYQTLNEMRSHFYEVIPENTPCRLYFDIEFKHQFNQTLNGNDVLLTFIAYVCHCIYQEFKIYCTKNNVIDLTSSTEQKFSRHLVFHHPELLFEDNIQCGEFVKEICFSLRSYLMTGLHNKFLPMNGTKHIPEISKNDLNDIMIYNEKNEKMFLCDLCVYTKNRNFRIFKSSKVSKNVPLIISNENKFKFKSKPYGREKYLKYQMRNEKFDADFEMFCDTLVCPANEVNTNFPVLKFGSTTCKKQLPATANNSKEKSTEIKSGTKSLFPDLDKFVLDIVDRNEPKGHIRRWIHHKEREIVIYDIGENRWCGNIQRQHKSNHIYYMADLRLAQLYQKCHDFECSNYRSEGTSIPPEVNPLYNGDGTIEEFGDTVLDDESLAAMLGEDITVAGKKDNNSNSVQNQSTENLYKSEFENLSDFFDNDDDSIDGCDLLVTGTSSQNTIFKKSSNDSTGDLFNYDGVDDDEIFLDKSLPLETDDHNNSNDSRNSRNNSFDLFEESEMYTHPNSKTFQNCDTDRFANNCPGSNSEFEPHTKIQKINQNKKNEPNCNVGTFTLSQESQLNDIFKDDFIFNEL